MISQEILKGTIKPLIIKLIEEEGEMYGYQITQKVKEISSDRLLITEGALYPALHKLVDEGILVAESKPVGNRERKYYSLTELGKKSAASKLDEVRDSIMTLAQLFDLQSLGYAVK